MRLTKEQRSDLEDIMDRARAYMKKNHHRSYPRLADDLKEISKTKLSLQRFRWSKTRISNLKRDIGIPLKRQSIIVESQEKKLLSWIKERIHLKVTTSMVKEKWGKIYFGVKKPTKSNLHRFRHRNGFTTRLNKQTGNKDVWVLK